MPFQELPDALIIECAERLGAIAIPIEAIQKAWASKMSDRYGWGCLNSDSGKKLFVAYRLREFGCFEVGCQSEEVPDACFISSTSIPIQGTSLTRNTLSS